jgi:hypothetical protein
LPRCRENLSIFCRRKPPSKSFSAVARTRKKPNEFVVISRIRGNPRLSSVVGIIQGIETMKEIKYERKFNEIGKVREMF